MFGIREWQHLKQAGSLAFHTIHCWCMSEENMENLWGSMSWKRTLQQQTTTLTSSVTADQLPKRRLPESRRRMPSVWAPEIEPGSLVRRQTDIALYLNGHVSCVIRFVVINCLIDTHVIPFLYISHSFKISIFYSRAMSFREFIDNISIDIEQAIKDELRSPIFMRNIINWFKDFISLKTKTLF